MLSSLLVALTHAGVYMFILFFSSSKIFMLIMLTYNIQNVHMRAAYDDFSNDSDDMSSSSKLYNIYKILQNT